MPHLQRGRERILQSGLSLRPPEERTPPSPARTVADPSLFDNIAPRYELLNLLLSGGLVIYWDYEFRKKLLEVFSPGRRGVALEIGCGAMPLRRALARVAPNLRVLGVDLSWGMLQKGRATLAPSAARRTLLAIASGLELPLASNSVDLVICQFVLRNIPQRREALKEALRVLKPGGTLFVLEFGSGRRRIWVGLYNFYLNRLLPKIAGLFSKHKGAYHYLVQSILDFPLPEVLSAELREIGFREVNEIPFTSGVIFMHTGRKAAR